MSEIVNHDTRMKSNMKYVLKNVDIKYTESYQFDSHSGIDTLGYDISMKWPMGRPPVNGTAQPV